MVGAASMSTALIIYSATAFCGALAAFSLAEDTHGRHMPQVVAADEAASDSPQRKKRPAGGGGYGAVDNTSAGEI